MSPSLPVARDPGIDLLFGSMEKLGPGSDADTLRVLRLLPTRPRRLVVDAGCGTGRQTLALAGALAGPVHAVDSYPPFLDELRRREQAAGLAPRVQTHSMDMKDIPLAFREIDLLWSEGAAYNIGFANALETWAPALAAGGLVVVSELSWLKEQVPRDSQEFFSSAYPEMQSVAGNIAIAKAAGYAVLATHVLPRDTWVDGYYDVLRPRARRLLDHPDPAVRELAAETVREIDVFEGSGDSYGYVFYVLQHMQVS